MVNNIFEELPSRKNIPARPQRPEKSTGRDEKETASSNTDEASAKRIRQAVYDIKYRARREKIPVMTAFSQYMQNTSMSGQERAAVRSKLSENYNIGDFAVDSVTNALHKVFIEGVTVKSYYDPSEEYLEELNNTPGTKYKVIVTDKNTNSSYVRYATREKINKLRSNPNIASVEMTHHGEPYEGERTKGEKTAEVTSGKKSKKDYDGDGKIESGAKEYRGAVHNAIQRKKGGVADGKDTSSVKEQVEQPVTNKKKLTGEGTDNTKRVKVFPDSRIQENSLSKSHQKFLDILQEREMLKSEMSKENKLKKKYDSSGMKASMEKQYGEEKGKKVYFATIRKQAMGEENCASDEGSPKGKKGEDDMRSVPTKMNIAKNKLRSMGMRI